METLWFWLVAIMITGYVVLDGFDIGAGIAHLFVARSDEEKRTVLASIGPVWDGNEVWLLAGGGTLYFAFPGLYAASFSGFYLPLIIILWLLVVRGISIEFRNHISSPVWTPVWDFGFAFASLLLAVLYGAAVGNVVRGVPLDSTGYFFLPLWTDFRAGSAAGILDWYTILTGVAALLALTMHGALWVALKCLGPVRDRAVLLARRVWWGAAAATVAITAASFAIQPHLSQRFVQAPAGVVFPVIAAAGLLGVFLCKTPRTELLAFLSSCAYLVGMMTSAAFGVYPLLLPASTDPTLSLTIDNAAAGSYGLHIGLAWWIPGMFLTTAYAIFTYRVFSGKLLAGDAGAAADRHPPA
jgi:cytochrome bd ubiquinol oxidase subunit II